MDVVGAIVGHAGLLTFTLLAVALILYLAYTMLHPERF